MWLGGRSPNLCRSKSRDAERGYLPLHHPRPAHLIWDQVAETDAFVDPWGDEVVRGHAARPGAKPCFCGVARVPVHVSDGPQTVIRQPDGDRAGRGGGSRRCIRASRDGRLASNNNYWSQARPSRTWWMARLGRRTATSASTRSTIGTPDLGPGRRDWRVRHPPGSAPYRHPPSRRPALVASLVGSNQKPG